MTSSGGANSAGVIFQFDSVSNTCVTKYDFDGIHGSSPYGSLLQASNGKMYGVTSGGGANNFGVVFDEEHVLLINHLW